MAGKAEMMKRNMIEKQTIAYQDHETDQLLLPPGSARCDPTETLRSQAATSAARAGLFSKASLIVKSGDDVMAGGVYRERRLCPPPSLQYPMLAESALNQQLFFGNI
jgi:hypothetical protein